MRCGQFLKSHILNKINHIIYIFITQYKYILYNYTPENERNGSFSGCVNGGAGQRKAQPPKTSGYAHFWGLWMVVVARGRTNPRKRAVVLISRVGVGWCWPEEGPTPENEMTARFWEVWVVMVARGKSNPQKQA